MVKHLEPSNGLDAELFIKAKIKSMSNDTHPLHANSLYHFTI